MDEVLGDAMKHIGPQDTIIVLSATWSLDTFRARFIYQLAYGPMGI